MKKQLIAVGIMVTLLVIGFSGCTENSSEDRSKFIGKWLSNQNLFIFYSNGTFDSVFYGDSNDGTWELKDEKLVMYWNYGEMIMDYSFSNNDDTLTLSLAGDDGTYAPEIFTRQYGEQKLFGTWKQENGDLELTLNSDGTYVWGDSSGTYEYDNDKLYMNFGNTDLTYEYEFSDYDIILTLTYVDTGESERYIKQP